MKFTAIAAILIAATGAIAAPGGGPPPPPPPPPPPKPAPPTIGQQSSSITCSSGAPYCCDFTTSKGLSFFKCSNFNDVCNSIAVCCNNQANQGSNAAQTCAAFGSAKVVFV